MGQSADDTALWSEDIVQQSVLPFHCEGIRSYIQATRLGSKHLYLQHPLSGPFVYLLMQDDVLSGCSA